MVVSDPEILSFSPKVSFIELAEVFGVKIICIFLCLKACIFKKHHTFLLFIVSFLKIMVV